MATGQMSGERDDLPKKTRSHGWSPWVYNGQILAWDLEKALDRLDALRKEYRSLGSGGGSISSTAREIVGQWQRCVDAWRLVVNDPDVPRLPQNSIPRVERFERTAKDFYAGGWIAQIPEREGLQNLLRRPPPPSFVATAPPPVRPAPIQAEAPLPRPLPTPEVMVKPPPPPLPETSLTPQKPTGVRPRFRVAS
jgi:hypothetical protein